MPASARADIRRMEQEATGSGLDRMRRFEALLEESVHAFPKQKGGGTDELG